MGGQLGRYSAFQQYLDLEREPSQAMASISIEGSDDGDRLYTSRYCSRSEVEVKLLPGPRPSVEGL